MEFISITTPWLLLWLPLAAAVLFLFVKITSSSSGGRRRLLPPGPKPLPVVGNMLDLGDNPNQSLALLAKTFGAVMTLRLGLVDTVVISSAEIAREVLQKHDAVLSNRSVPDSIRAVAHHAHSMVWIPAGSQWRNLRRISNTHLYSPQRLDAYEAVRCQKAQEAMEYIAYCSAEGLPIDVGRVAFTTALNLISRTVFSTDMADLYGQSSQEFKDVVEGIMLEIGRPNISDFFPFLASLDLQGNRRRTTAYFEKLHRIFDDQIDQRISNKEKGINVDVTNDLLDALLQSKIQEDESKSERITLKSMLTDIFVAGSDTSSSTVEWAMAELIRSPPAMAKAREEIARVIGFEKELKESDINDLPYLQAVVKETLRLHPPTPFLIPRKADAAVELEGYQVPKGTRLIVNAWAIGRDGGVWTDPEQFTPERFTGSEVDYRGRHFELIPFGAGRRICPGVPLAHRMVHLILASMLQKFEWRLPEGKKPEDMDMSEKFGITLEMASSLRALAFPH